MLTWKNARRVIVFVIGMTVVLIGIALIVLPGPAFLVIPAGLAILATEFVWAAVLLKKVKEKAKKAMGMKQDKVTGFPVESPVCKGNDEKSSAG